MEVGHVAGDVDRQYLGSAAYDLLAIDEPTHDDRALGCFVTFMQNTIAIIKVPHGAGHVDQAGPIVVRQANNGLQPLDQFPNRHVA